MNVAALRAKQRMDRELHDEKKITRLPTRIGPPLTRKADLLAFPD